MKKTLKFLIALAVGQFASLTVNADEGIKVEHLGANNTLVRVDSEQNYLLMPVQEMCDNATVNVIVDGRLDRTIYVRLAKSKVDYNVPFDLTPYKGHNVVLNIESLQNRSGIRDVKQDVCWKNFLLTDTISQTNREKYRSLFHHTPLYGWMNDPNGMFYKDGVWHLYYQWNPYGSKWQNMTWGHSTSTDLVHWTHHGAAIEPNGLGTVFSGSSAIDYAGSAGFGKGALVALYTSAGISQTQSLAWSNDDGATFNIYSRNPVITLESEARDPNMFWDDETKLWTLILAHSLDHEMLIFTSSDMKEWKLQSSFGKGLGAQGGVWECPDLFKLQIPGTDIEKWVLICNINPGGPFGGSGIQYFVGEFDGKTFTADTDAVGHVPTKWLDFGKDNYALVSWSDAPDGRRTVIGWMSNWQYAAEVPTKQFRSANTLPRDLVLFKGKDGQYYVASEPVKELESLRGKLISNQSNVRIGVKGHNFDLPKSNDGIGEILLTIDPEKAQTVNITLSNSNDEKVVMTYSPVQQNLSFDRRSSGEIDFSQDFPSVTVAPTFGNSKEVQLRIFIDRSSIEVFINGGRSVMTNLVFPTVPYNTLSVSAGNDKARIKELKIYSID